MSVKGLQTAGAAARSATLRLKEAGMETPALDARLLVASVLGVDAARLFSHPEMPVNETQQQTIDQNVDRRLRHEPVSRILGVREFWSLAFEIDNNTLDPRPDSETLVEAVLTRVTDRAQPMRLLDMGTGSGCLLLALLSELPRAEGIGVDINPGAVQMAQRNAINLGLDNRARFVCSDWFADETIGPDKAFDVLISNPPYISEQEMKELDRDVIDYDPALALAGGSDGLDAYRVLLPEFASRVADRGFVAFEIGWTQAAAIKALGEGSGLELGEVVTDLAGRDRVLIFDKAS